MEKYSYILENVKADYLDKIKDNLSTISEIKEYEIIEDKRGYKLIYGLDSQVAEYDIFVKICAFVQDLGGDLGFEEDIKPVYKKEEIIEEKKEIIQDKPTEKIEKKKKKLKFTGGIEKLFFIIASLMFYFVLGLDKPLQACVCLVLVAYGIFYDAISDVSRKKITSNCAVAIAVIILAFIGEFYICFFVGLLYLILTLAISSATEFFTNKLKHYGKFTECELSDGTMVNLTDLKSGDNIHVQGVVLFPCKVVEGQSNVIRDGEVISVSLADVLQVGDQVESILVCEMLCDYTDSEFKRNLDKENYNLERATCGVELNIKWFIPVAFWGLILLAMLIIPIFLEWGYKTSFILVAYRVSAIFALSLPLVDFGRAFGKILFLKSANVLACVEDISLIENLTNIQEICYNENVFIDENGNLRENAFGILRELRDLGIKKQSCVSTSDKSIKSTCEKLKLNTFKVVTIDELDKIKSENIFIDYQNGTFNVYVLGELAFTFKEEVRTIPNVVKFCKKQKTIDKYGFILGCIFQTLFAILGVCGILSVHFSTLCAMIVSLLITSCYLIQFKKSN